MPEFASELLELFAKNHLLARNSMNLRRGGELVDLVLGQFNTPPCPIEHPSEDLLPYCSQSITLDCSNLLWETGSSPSCPIKTEI
jgi:hypothetical protein